MSDIIVWYAPQEFMAAMVVIVVIALVVAAKAARRLRRGNIASVEVLDD
jgi:hypothetical protein